MNNKIIDVDIYSVGWIWRNQCADKLVCLLLIRYWGSVLNFIRRILHSLRRNLQDIYSVYKSNGI